MNARDRHRRAPAIRCPRGTRYPHLHLAERAATTHGSHGRRTPKFCRCGGYHLNDKDNS